jgi:hypothetical protein
VNDDYEMLLWRARETSGFTESTWKWGDESDRWFWRVFLEGMLYEPPAGPRYARVIEDAMFVQWRPA